MRRGAGPAARLRTLLLATVATLVLPGCGGKGIDTSPAPGGGTDCGAARLNSAVLDTARQWYLFPELLPANPNPADFPCSTSSSSAATATRWKPASP